MNSSLFDKLPSFIRVRLKGHDSLQLIIANIWWLFFDKIVRMGVGVFVGAWVARYLGSDQFGIFNYATAFVALFSVLATLGLDAIVVRNIVRDPTCKNTALGTAFVLKIVGGAVTLFITLIAIYTLRPADNLTMLLVGITAAGTIFQAFEAIDFWFQSQVRSKYTVYVRNIAFLAVSAAKVVLISIQAPLVAFAIAGLIEIILVAAGMIMVYRITGNSITTWRFSFETAKVLLKDSWPLIISGIVIMIYLRIDQIMLGQMKGAREVGLYSAAVKISEIWYFIPTVIVNSVFPSIVAVRTMNEKLYYKRLQNLFTIMVLLSLVVAVPVTFFSDWIIRLLYGATYKDAGVILAIQVWTGVFVFLGVARGPWIITEGLTRLSFATTTFGAVTNIILNLVLIPKYSAIGASIATVISYLIASVVANVFFHKTRIIFYMQMRAMMMLDLKYVLYELRK